jgi:hypothetical protein
MTTLRKDERALLAEARNPTGTGKGYESMLRQNVVEILNRLASCRERLASTRRRGVYGHYK